MLLLAFFFVWMIHDRFEFRASFVFFLRDVCFCSSSSFFKFYSSRLAVHFSIREFLFLWARNKRDVKNNNVWTFKRREKKKRGKKSVHSFNFLCVKTRRPTRIERNRALLMEYWYSKRRVPRVLGPRSAPLFDEIVLLLWLWLLLEFFFFSPLVFLPVCQHAWCVV